MEEAVIATFDDVKFIEGATKMSQRNWQKYFSTVIKNGVYEGLEPRNYVNNTQYTDGHRIITDGTVFVNGICATIETQNGYTDIGTLPSGVRDRFVCVRVYFDSQTAQLVQKTNITPAPTAEELNHTFEYNIHYYHEQLAVKKFSINEAFCCDRNNTYWDIPIFYQGLANNAFSEGVDLRRMMKYDPRGIINPEYTPLKNILTNNIMITGNNVYRIEMLDNSVYFPTYPYYESPHDIYLNFDLINKPNHAKLIVTYSRALSTTQSAHIYIPKYWYSYNNLIVPYSPKARTNSDFEIYYNIPESRSLHGETIPNPLGTEDTKYYDAIDITPPYTTGTNTKIFAVEINCISTNKYWDILDVSDTPYSERYAIQQDVICITNLGR